METAASQDTMRCPSCRKQLPKGTVFCPWDGSALESTRATAPRVDPLIDAQVGDYVVQERIGAGGMGIVYRAIQPLIGKQVAIKVLKAEFSGAQELVQRLLVEARVVNAIQHRGIIDIFGFGQLPDGRPYVVMELLQGISLDQLIKWRGRVGGPETVAILDEILSALGAAHRAGVIHRDLKPGNVFLVDGADGTRAAKILDFGIAKVTASQGGGPMTMQGMLLGTPEYMAPEQIRGTKVEATADLYAVGVMAFQMLTGKRPFAGEQLSVLFAQVEEAPVSPSSLVPEISPELERIVLRLLAKNPAQRFQTAEAVRHELQSVQEEPARRRPAMKVGPEHSKTIPPVPSPPTGATTVRLGGVVRAKPPKPSRSRWLAGGGAIALSGIAAVGLLTVWKKDAPPREQVPVTAEQPKSDVPPEVSAQALPEAPPGPEAVAEQGSEEEKPQEAVPQEMELLEMELQEVGLDSASATHRPKRKGKPLTRKVSQSEPLTAPAPPPMAVSMASNAQPAVREAPVIVPQVAEAKPPVPVVPPAQRTPVEAVGQVASPSPRDGLAACRPSRFDRRTQQTEILLSRLDCLEARAHADAAGKKASSVFLGEIGRLRQAAKAVRTASERMTVTQSVDALRTRYDQQHGVLVLPAMASAPVSPPTAAGMPPASKPAPSEEAVVTTVETSSQPGHSRSRIDRNGLLLRISQNEARLSETQGLGREDEALGALTKLDKLVRKAETASERMAVAIQLDEWEKKFLPKR
ncbi:serine/threonine protein kinase [Stigmatella aurantiaca]|uniref:non-specific serine/threonine protein kinase n=1 Tax=Stigmatella aurantiaca TaxID=41 RepID=A0A1H7XM00_STIAU|nr:serine/threonine protein kinase [Stigmatella aurantiaca]